MRAARIGLAAVVATAASMGCAQIMGVDVDSSKPGGNDTGGAAGAAAGGAGGAGGVGGAGGFGGAGGAGGAGGEGGSGGCVAGALEVCGNGLDDDCDAYVDEDCPCVEGLTQPCYPAPLATKDVGPCKAGTSTCVGGFWGTCEGAITPAEDSCNGVDDDCDSLVDEDLGISSCGLGACMVTVAACENGAPPACVPAAPTEETCDGLDNDCDGEVDDGNPGAGADCMVPGALGECKRGTVNCVDGALACVSNAEPQPESCDGKDNDCDGDTDEGPPDENLPCNTNLKGICNPGTTKCDTEIGVLTCNSLQTPMTELCNDDDEDCDGGVGKALYTQTFSTLDSWVVGGEWAIKAAASGCNDPSDDATSTTSDKMLAGVNVGGCASGINGSGYLTSKSIPVLVEADGGQLWLRYKRWLRTSGSMLNTIEMKDSGSNTWKEVWSSQSKSFSDPGWHNHRIDLTPYLGSTGWIQVQLRWKYTIGAIGDQGGWSVDDVELLDDDCQ